MGIVNGKVDILNCTLGVVKKIADALNLMIDELLTLCDKNHYWLLTISGVKLPT